MTRSAPPLVTCTSARETFWSGTSRLLPSSTQSKGSVANPPDGNAGLVKYIGNVPASGKPPAGLLRHRGWRATAVSLPQLSSKVDLAVIAPAEIEVE